VRIATHRRDSPDKMTCKINAHFFLATGGQICSSLTARPLPTLSPGFLLLPMPVVFGTGRTRLSLGMR
jgi:hypothetical protein